ncbi:hypothetical protein ACODM8_14365 [Vibrio ostreicida]|uniref:hypothetical protein n=1 Tax=Vibrio ostreicida TaxID=526588 RepID=UPI003B593A82
MSIVIQQFTKLETSLSDYLKELNQNPPFGFGQCLKPLNQSFQMCRILGNQMKAQHVRIEKLEKQLNALASGSNVEGQSYE